MSPTITIIIITIDIWWRRRRRRRHLCYFPVDCTKAHSQPLPVGLFMRRRRWCCCCWYCVVVLLVVVMMKGTSRKWTMATTKKEVRLLGDLPWYTLFSYLCPWRKEASLCLSHWLTGSLFATSSRRTLLEEPTTKRRDQEEVNFARPIRSAPHLALLLLYLEAAPSSSSSSSAYSHNGATQSEKERRLPLNNRLQEPPFDPSLTMSQHH